MGAHLLETEGIGSSSPSPGSDGVDPGPGRHVHGRHVHRRGGKGGHAPHAR